jgi:CRISPR-associated endonuclease Csn1
MAKLVLGLDLGPNSIGWALVRDDEQNPGNSNLVDAGVRVFPEGVDAFDTSKEASRNEQRRIKRGMRRQIQRRARRQRELCRALIQVGLWPSGAAEQNQLMQTNPYELRAKGIVEKLQRFEVGRVLLHLNQRRGFLSNRKKDSGDAEVKGMLKEINDNEAARIAAGFPTMGALLAHKLQTLDHCHRTNDDHIRHRHLARAQYVSEFDLLWDTQAKHHPDVLTPNLRNGSLGGDSKVQVPIPKDDERRKGHCDLDTFGIHGLIFFQRRMYWPKSVVGLCELESKEKRCPKSDRRAERFRVLSEINNLRFADTDRGEEHPLSETQRKLLLSYLATKERATFDEIRKKLGFLDTIKFNLERGERSGIKGFTVDVLMSKAVGKEWHEYPEEKKNLIVELLLNSDLDDDLMEQKLANEMGLSTVQAAKAIAVDLPPGYAGHSLKALLKLLPPMERGLVYQSSSDPEISALHAAGYLRRDELQRRLFDKLPDLSRLRQGETKLGDIPNPVVKRALVEMRKVLNAIIREYGKPDEVHIELARTVQVGAEKRKEMSKRMNDRAKERDKAADEIRSQGVAVRREGILRYLLWKEQGSDCVYCGKTISQHQLFGGEIDIDHILPRHRSLDDSQMNKVVCHSKCNHDKKDRTPHEWLADTDPKRYDQIIQRAGALLKKGSFPYAKYRRFLQKELDLENFVARQLSDTGYITRATMEYVRMLFDKDHVVLGLKGQLTAELRYHWGLDTILEELPDSPAWQEKEKLTVGEKNRADHRHHAIDAIVLALTNRRRLHQLSDIVQRGGAKRHGEILMEPWDNFRDTVVARVKQINVSHRVDRKVAGALHEETLYGQTEKPDEWVVRKPVESLSANEIDRIRDKTIREIIQARLKEHDIEFGRGKKGDEKKMKGALANLKMPSGVPIKKVRITKQEKTIRPLHGNEQDQAFVKPGSTHHLCIFEYVEKGKTKREAVFVTMLEATQRLKRAEPIIQKSHPERPEARFVMSLSAREMVLAEWKSEKRLLTFKTSSAVQGTLRFALHTDARRYTDQTPYFAIANTLDARKVTVDPIGRIRWAND